MNAAFRIAREEWRLWARSRVVLIAALTIAVLVTVTSVLTALRVTDEAAARSARQASAEAAFFPNLTAIRTAWSITDTMPFARPRHLQPSIPA